MAYAYEPDGTKYVQWAGKDPNIVLGIAGGEHERPHQDLLKGLTGPDEVTHERSVKYFTSCIRDL